MNKNPDFLIIPHQLILDKNLQPLDRILYGVIYWLAKLKNEKCIASNRTLKELCGCKTNRAISNSLETLEKNKYIIRIYFNKKTKERSEIVPLIAYGVVPSPPYEQMMTPLRTNDDTIINKKIKEEIASPPATPSVFNLKEELTKLKESPQRHVQLIGEFLEEKGVALENTTQLKRAIGRHLRAARELADFSDKQIAKASEQAQDEYPKLWTIETLLKLITK